MQSDDELAPLFDPTDPVLLPLPAPGAGCTRERFHTLWNIAARSPSLARVVEAHHDAHAILLESGRTSVAPGLHAVWAAGGPAPLQLQHRNGGWHLQGSKQWCSAATLAEHALVTAQTPHRSSALVLVALAREGIRAEPSNWQSPAMASVDTRTMHFDLDIDVDDVIGTDDWYLKRPGFWHGAVGVAACWAGCADGIVDRLSPHWRHDPHAVAHLGAIDAALWDLRTIVGAAADDIDDTPLGTDASRQQRALRVRHLVDAGVAEILTRCQRAVGPGPLAHTENLHRHIAEADMYRRQSHAERDLEVLGNLTRSHWAPQPTR